MGPFGTNIRYIIITLNNSLWIVSIIFVWINVKWIIFLAIKYELLDCIPGKRRFFVTHLSGAVLDRKKLKDSKVKVSGTLGGHILLAFIFYPISTLYHNLTKHYFYRLSMYSATRKTNSYLNSISFEECQCIVKIL